LRYYRRMSISVRVTVGSLLAFLSRYRIRFIAGAAALVIGLALFFVFRDTSVVIAVPKADVEAYVSVLKSFAARPDAPKTRVEGFEGSGTLILEGKRPGIAVVSLAPWIGQALDRGNLKLLPEKAFETGMPVLPKCIGDAIGPERAMLPLAFDPWLMAWHRDFIGGKKAVPPRLWTDLPKLGKSIRRSGANALALPGREGDADLAWLAIHSSAQDQKAAAAAFVKFPLEGRETIAKGMEAFAGMQKDGLVQAGSFSYPWGDAVGLLLDKKAAGILLPLSRYRSIDPIDSAPLIVSLLPELSGSRDYALIADLRVLVMPSRGAAGKGVEKVIGFFAETATQRALADRLDMMPALLNAPIRDGAAYAAMEAARSAGTLIPHPASVLGEKRAADFSAALEKALRSPREIPSILADLYGVK
jgi:ABC-type glycerol-3-phosphate transport system substrate-binding protein